MLAIKCKAGNVISACNTNFVDSEFILEQAYYKAQGCTIEKVDSVIFSDCDCLHCKSLQHQFQTLIEDIVSSHNK